ncbi:hypothetical protein [Kitasatospora sp. NPDC056181]|uniref:phage tail protein n=1 Tax=Kitasatospora sp. NPDC056181 TaxID=3345737 RepID=UPI0035DD7F1A
MALTVGELVAHVDVDVDGAERGVNRAERILEGFQRTSDGRLRTMQGRFAAASQAIGRDLGDGVEEGTSRASAAVEAFTRDTQGRLRDARGRFVTAGQQAGAGFAGGFGDGAGPAVDRVQHSVRALTGDLDRGGESGGRFSGVLGRLAGMAGPLGGVAGRVGMIAAQLGTAVPSASALLGVLVQMAPAAGLAATGILAVVSANAALKIGMSGVSDAVKAALDPSDPEAYAEALKKLSPNARAFVEEIHQAQPALDALKRSVQDRLFDGLASTLQNTATSVLPILRNSLTNTAGALNLMGKQVLNTATGLGKSGALGTALSYANSGLYNMASLPATIVQGLVQIAAAAGPSFSRLTEAAGGAINGLSESMARAFANGGMQRAIEQAISMVGDLVEVVANVGRVIGTVMNAANTNGGGLLGTLKAITAAMADAFAQPAVQSALSALFSTMSLLAKTAAPLLAQALGALGPVIVALAPGVQALIGALGPALSAVITALGPVLASLAKAVSSLAIAFAPVITVAGELIAALLPALTPLLDGLTTVFDQLAPVVKTLVTELGKALAPVLEQLPVILTPLVAIFTTLTGALLPILTQLIVALSPSIQQIATAFGQVMVALAPVLTQLATLLGKYLQTMLPLLTPIINAVGQLAAIFANNFAQALTQIVVPALTMVAQILSGDFEGAVESAKEVLRGLKQLAVREFTEMPGQILNVFATLGSGLYTAGTKIVQALIDGIKSRAGSVKNAVEDVLSAARNLLPFSPAKEGPFSGKGWSLYSGQSISQALADGILAGQSQVRAATASMMDAAHGGLDGPWGGPQTAMAGGFGGGLQITNYYEADSGSARATAEELAWMAKGRG